MQPPTPFLSTSLPSTPHMHTRNGGSFAYTCGATSSEKPVCHSGRSVTFTSSRLFLSRAFVSPERSSRQLCAYGPPVAILACRDLVSSSSTRKSGYHLTSNKTTCPTDFITFPQVSRTARAEATSLVRETRAKVGDLKGKVPYSIVRLRVLVKKHKPA